MYPYLHTLSLHDARPSPAFVGSKLSPGQIVFSTSNSKPSVPVTAMASYSATFRRKSSGPTSMTSGDERSTTSIVTVGGTAIERGVAVSCRPILRSEEYTSELQSLMRISYADFCLK